MDNLLANKLDLECTVTAGATGGTFKAEVQIDGVSQSGTVALKPNERKPIRLQETLPPAGRPSSMASESSRPD